MKDLYVWIRMGDLGEYERFDSPEDAAYEVAQWTSDRVCRFRSLGVELGPFTGLSYVSLYWGDDDAQPIDNAELSDTEKQAFQNILEAS